MCDPQSKAVCFLCSCAGEVIIYFLSYYDRKIFKVFSRDGVTAYIGWRGNEKGENVSNLLQLSVNFCRVYRRLRREDRC